MISRTLARQLGTAMGGYLLAPASQRAYFTAPHEEAALVDSSSVSWRIFKNPVALFIGGAAAVLLELAEPAVCAGVWNHSNFRSDPGRRLRHTGLAALVTVYGARSIAEPLIARVVRAHEGVRGVTAGGLDYAASDPRLLAWVHATAAYGFLEAYRRYVEPVSAIEQDQYYRESQPIARLYGAASAPACVQAMNSLLDTALPQLRPSPAIFEFLHIMATRPLLPGMLRLLQPMMLRAAIELLPVAVRAQLGLGERLGARAGETLLTRWAGAVANRLVLAENPAVQACQRLGLQANFLYR